jgi:CDGSH-type Zn-finger protein/uncharacterized Fe-S cluster protein YjdI
MSEKYVGRAQDRRYIGTDVDISYSLKRCIHAEFCVKHLAQVFDKNKRPWISPDGASAEEVATVNQLCPSGALHYERKDGGSPEPAPETNTIIVWKDGPLQFIADLTLNTATVALENETRATLCRCGASQNKPFCDNAHKAIGFSAHEVEPLLNRPESLPTGGRLNVMAQPNGPLEIEGNLEIRDEAGNTLFVGTKTALCRCGGSGRKPFCDGTHKTTGFRAE